MLRLLPPRQMEYWNMLPSLPAAWNPIECAPRNLTAQLLAGFACIGVWVGHKLGTEVPSNTARFMAVGLYFPLAWGVVMGVFRAHDRIGGKVPPKI
jgi:hypothetical protein